MGAVHATYFTDPACPWSWAAEPAVRRLLVEFGDDMAVTYVMGGLAREFRTPVETMRHVLDAAAASGMPTDPRLWLDAPDADPLRNRPAVLHDSSDDRSGAVGVIWSSIMALGEHDLDPGGSLVFTVTDGALNAIVTASFYRRGHTHAGA